MNTLFDKACKGIRPLMSTIARFNIPVKTTLHLFHTYILVGHMHRSIRGLPPTFAFQLILNHFLMLNPMVPPIFEKMSQSAFLGPRGQHGGQNVPISQQMMIRNCKFAHICHFTLQILMIKVVYETVAWTSLH